MLVRIKYALTEHGRFISHLDLLRTWHRLIRRANLPLAFSQGYSPKPKLSFASALAVGLTSDGEYLDVAFAEALPIAEVASRLQAELPPALHITDIMVVPAGTESLTAVINRAQYVLEIALGHGETEAGLAEKIRKFLALEEVFVERFKKNSRTAKRIDIRPGIFALTGHLTDDTSLVLTLLLKTGNEGNIRPEEVVYAMAAEGLLQVADILVGKRSGLFVAQGDALLTPLDVVRRRMAEAR